MLAPEQQAGPDGENSPDRQAGVHPHAERYGVPARRRLSRPRRLGRALTGLYAWLLGVTVAGVALRTLVGPVIRWTSSYDDENQMRVANALLHGEWLGVWGSQPVPSITLSKGPGYPFFVVVMNHLGVGPRVGAYVVYLAGALLLVLALRSHIGARWAGAVYALLAFCPDVMSISFSRPYRDQLVAALALLAVGAATALGVLLRPRGRPGWRVWVGAATLTLVLAGTLGLLAITRADTLWVVVTSLGAVLVVIGPVMRGLDLWAWVRVLVSAVVVGVALLAVPATVAALNDQHYGVRLTDDYSQGGFSDAVRDWMSVEAPSGEPFQLVTRPQRQAVYAVSSAAREVEQQLESSSNIWVGKGCGDRPASWGPCTEYGAFFGWAIRDAAFDVGYRDPAAFQSYFVRLSREISDACSTGRLSCGPRGLSADLPALNHVSLRVVVSGAVNLIGGSVKFADNMEGPQADVPSDPALVALWEDTMPDVRGLVDLLGAGQNPNTIVQQSTIDLLKLVYSILAVVALVICLGGFVSGLLFRSTAGRLAVVFLLAWVSYIGVVATVFAATNRQFVQTIPSYTLAGQALFITGLALSANAVWQVIRARLPRRQLQGSSHDDPTSSRDPFATHQREQNAATAYLRPPVVSRGQESDGAEDSQRTVQRFDE